MNNTTQSDPNYLSSWTPGAEICIIIETKAADGKPAEERTPEQINEFFDIMKCAANNLGFDLSTWGLRESFESAIKKRYIRAKIKETVQARDLQISQAFPEMKALLSNPLPIPEIAH